MKNNFGIFIVSEPNELIGHLQAIHGLICQEMELKS
jgi:hypothetical protein